jgi:hypothetical protein
MYLRLRNTSWDWTIHNPRFGTLCAYAMTPMMINLYVPHPYITSNPNQPPTNPPTTTE